MGPDRALRVLLVTKGLDLGGIERIVVDLAVGLRSRGLDVEVAVVNPERNQLQHHLDAAGVPVHPLGGTDRIGIAAARCAPAPDPHRRLRRRPCPRAAPRRALPALGRRPDRRRHHRAHAVDVTPSGLTTGVAHHRPPRRITVAVSAAVAESLPTRRSVIVLPHGVDPARIATALREARRAAHPDGVVAVTVASHRDAKNYPNLLRAVRVARDAGASLRLVAVGEGPALDDHRRLAADLGIGDVVTFEPPSDDVLARMAAADLLVVASDYEGQPMVVSEALALGKPVVATAVGRVPELVTTDVGRVVPPQDADALGRALAEVAGDEQLRGSMSKNAAARPMRPTLDDVLDTHLDLYTRAASKGAGTPTAR